jgi:hypothetical protein
LRVYLTSTRDFFKTWCVIKKDLNQGEGHFPARFFASSRPAIAEQTRRGKERKIDE